VTIKVLIVDDVAEMRDLLKAIVQKLQYISIEASSGQEAMAILQKNPDIKLILLDIGLPDISGLEFAAQLKSGTIHPHIFFVTGQSEYDAMVQAGKLGAVSFIVKPIRPSHVMERIQSILQNKKGAK